MMSDPTLLTIILNYKTPEMTLKSLSAALREMEGISGAITIVDNNSRDGSYETLQQAVKDQRLDHYDRVRVIQSGHNGGFGAGNNVGIRARLPNGDAPDYVYILNSDAFPDNGAIKRLLAELQSNTNAGFAGSYIHGEEGDPHITAFRFPTIQSELETAVRFGPISKFLKNYIVPLPLPSQTCTVDWLAGASLMMRQSVLDEIGLFDEQFFLYFEETDLCRRAKNAGWPTIYVRASEIAHIGSVSTGMKTWARMPTYWYDSRLYYFTKNHGRIYATVATAAHLIGGVLNRLRCAIQRKPRSDPPKFLRGMAAHYICSTTKSLFNSSQKPKNTVTRIISQDTK